MPQPRLLLKQWSGPELRHESRSPMCDFVSERFKNPRENLEHT